MKIKTLCQFKLFKFQRDDIFIYRFYIKKWVQLKESLRISKEILQKVDQGFIFIESFQNPIIISFNI